jgi:DDE superfamily endonuclease
MQNPKLFPYFEDALGAIDGTHISCAPSASEREFARNRKGGVSQNCLMACSFDLNFLYVLSGWEGSAADATVFNDARTSTFHIPQGKFYLADAGFALCDEVLVPYRGVRYHLNEWQRAEQR